MKKKGLSCNSIGRKLLITMVLLCLVPVITVGVIANYQSRSKLTEKLETMSTQAVAFISDGIDDYLENLKQMMNITALHDDLENAYKKENASAMTDYFASIVDSRDDVSYIYLARSDKKMYIHPSVNLPADYDPTTREWYRNAILSPNTSIISKPYVDAATGEIIVTISKAVLNRGEIVGVAAADFTLQAIAKTVSDKTIGNTGQLFIIDRGDFVLAHSDFSLLGSKVSESNPEFWKAVQGKKEDFIHYNFNGEEKFGAFKTNETTGWIICAGIMERELLDDTNVIRTVTLIVTAIIGVIGVIGAFIMSRGVSSNICHMLEVLDSAASGDLTPRVETDRKDEFGELAKSFNSTLDQISSLLSNVVRSSDEVMKTSHNLASRAHMVNKAVEEVTHAVSDVSQGSISQAEDAQTGLIEMENISKQLDGISEHSGEIYNISTYTKNLSEKGFEIIDLLTSKSLDAQKAAQEASAVVEDMYNSSLQISNISDTLVSITAQTNLLSLNAGIEAARAGEAGKGFIVVANEVRKLAEESKSSTAEIKLIIEGIQSKASTVAEAIRLTGDMVNAQEAAVADTRDIFEKILHAIEELSVKVTDITGSIKNTNQNKNVLLEIIHSVSATSQQGAAAVEEVTASSEEISANVEEFTKYAAELKELAEDLSREVHHFKV